METCFNTGRDDNLIYMSSDERKWINKIHSLSSSYNEVVITRLPEENDGCIVATFPKRWLKISPTRRMSDEQRLKCSEVLRKARENQSNLNEFDLDE